MIRYMASMSRQKKLGKENTHLPLWKNPKFVNSHAWMSMTGSSTSGLYLSKPVWLKNVYIGDEVSKENEKKSVKGGGTEKKKNKS